MNLRRLVAIVTLLAVLAVGVATPTPARADTTDDFIYAGIALGAYVGIVILATQLIYGSPSELALTPADLDVRRDDIPEPVVHVGKRCKQSAPSYTLLCW